MFYCPKCLNVYSISKSIKQIGGASYNLEDIIKKILSDDIEEGEYDTFDNKILDELKDYGVFKKLSASQKDIVYNFIDERIENKTISKAAPKIKQKMYFVCTSCGNNEEIEKNTRITVRSSDDYTPETNTTQDIEEYLHMDILPRTRQYDCPNEKCESHTEPEKKSALFMRIKNTYKMKYICESCKTSWNVK
jgi:hypothetical protein